MLHIGTQTFGLGKELTYDLAGTLYALHDIGFDAIEPFVLFNEKQVKNPKNLWAYDTLSEALPMLEELKMDIPSIHIGIGFGWLSMPVSRIAKNLLFLQEKTGVSVFVVSGLFSTLAQTKHWAKLMKKISDAVHPNGITILYHTHDDEFRKISYRTETKEALEVFFDIVGQDVKLQLDIGWAALAGDEISIAKRYADRIVSLHLKDFYLGFQNSGYTRITMPDDMFAPIGDGAVSHAEIIAMKDRFSHFNGTLIIDQDKTTGDMLKALKTGYANIMVMAGERR